MYFHGREADQKRDGDIVKIDVTEGEISITSKPNPSVQLDGGGRLSAVVPGSSQPTSNSRRQQDDIEVLEVSGEEEEGRRVYG